jgi:hypothetical protein
MTYHSNRPRLTAGSGADAWVSTPVTMQPRGASAQVVIRRSPQVPLPGEPPKPGVVQRTS